MGLRLLDEDHLLANLDARALRGLHIRVRGPPRLLHVVLHRLPGLRHEGDVRDVVRSRRPRHVQHLHLKPRLRRHARRGLLALLRALHRELLQGRLEVGLRHLDDGHLLANLDARALHTLLLH